MPTNKSSDAEVALHLGRYVPGLLAWLSNKLAVNASQVYRSRFGVGVIEWRILSYLAVHERGTGARMSHLMGADKAAISRGASFLEDKKLIQSKKGFGRNLEFTLTPKGRKLHDRIVQLALAREEALLDGLNKEEIGSLIKHLHVLLNNLQKVEAIDSVKY